MISIYNIYRPNYSTIATAGIDTIWIQQWQCLKKENPDIDPRRRCIEDLITIIQQGQEKNELAIVIGDFNEDINKDKGFGIKDLME